MTDETAQSPTSPAPVQQHLSAAQPTTPPQIEFEDAGAVLRRPLALIGDTSYVATWLTMRGQSGPQLFIAAQGPSEAALYGPGGLQGVKLLDDVPVTMELPFEPEPDALWSGAGLNAFLGGHRASPADVFRRLVSVIDRFIDFANSLADQPLMCALVALYIMQTYFIDAFTVVGYLWATGGSGSGKTQLLSLVARLAYLGRFLLPTTTCPTLRDEAHYGATLCLDDAESLADPRLDPEKRTLLLAGNRKGSTVGLKEPIGRRSWRTRWVNTYSSRTFSAINLPYPVLASRSIMVPLVKTADRSRADADPNEDILWPHARRDLVDDLWNLALCCQAKVRNHYRQASTQAMGREFEPWRGLLAVARLVEEDGETRLVARLGRLVNAYQAEKADFSSPDDNFLVVRALVEFTRRLAPVTAGSQKSAGDMVTLSDVGDIKFHARELTRVVNELAVDEGLVEPGATYMTEKKLGLVLNRLRVPRLARTGKDGRRRKTTGSEVERLARAYGVVDSQPDSSLTSPLVTSSLTSAADTYEEVWEDGREPF